MRNRHSTTNNIVFFSTAEALPEDDFFLDVAQSGEVSVVSEVDREAMGDANNIYTVTFAAAEPDDGCAEPPCEALNDVTLRIQVSFGEF